MESDALCPPVVATAEDYSAWLKANAEKLGLNRKREWDGVMPERLTENQAIALGDAINSAPQTAPQTAVQAAHYVYEALIEILSE